MDMAVEKITRRLGIQMNLTVPDLVHGVLQSKDAWVSEPVLLDLVSFFQSK